MNQISCFIKKAKEKANSASGPSSKIPTFIPKDERLKRKADDDINQASSSKAKFSRRMDILPPPPPSQNYIEEQQSLRAGSTRQKRDQSSMSSRKFKFDWNEEDDTSANNRDDLVNISLLKTDKKKDSSLAYKKKNPYDDMHWTKKPLEFMTERDWRILREDFNIVVKGGNIPKPIRSWTESPFQTELKDIIFHIGYLDPTPIQRQAIPLSLHRRDVIGVAETGSGKTACFLIPLISHIMRLPKITEHNASRGPYALIIAPTRELAQQIEQEAIKFCRPLGFHCSSIVGGRSMEDQALNVRMGVEILIGTPGRLKDCLERRIFVLSQCCYVVLDEADRMMDMGFEVDVNAILKSIPIKAGSVDFVENLKTGASAFGHMDIPQFRQTTMFSATMPPEVEKIARTYMTKPAVVTIGSAGQTVETVEQNVDIVNESQKLDRLFGILARGFEPPVIIFVNQKVNVDLVAKKLDNDGYKAITLHGGKAQDAREAALESLKSGHKDILVATDVAGRGIDIPDVSLVINYDMPKKIDDYVHRIGRTGRAGKTGKAITFLTSDDADIYFDLKQVLIKANAKIPPALAKHEAAQGKAGTVAPKRRQDEVVYRD